MAFDLILMTDIRTSDSDTPSNWNLFFNPACPLLVISTNITAFYICNFFFCHCINFIFNVERVYSVAKLLLISKDFLFGSLKWYVCICRNCVVETTDIGPSATFLSLKMRPTKICEEEIEKVLAMSDEDEEDFSVSEREFETNLLEEGMNSSEDDSSDNLEDWNEEPPPQAPQDNIIPFSKRFLRGKNKYKWATTKGKRRRSAINIVHHARGPTGAAKNVTDCAEVFKLFINDEILSIIVHYTNIEIEKRNGDFPTEKPVNKTELEALIGILILSAVMKDNHLTSLELFNKEYSGTRYISTMSRSRFCFLISCLRFDDRSERVLHLNDRFAAIREVWDKFTQKRRDNFKPGLYLTVDEQLLAFRGRCLFRMYIPNKPAKYGLKIIMLCDSGTSYVVDAMPYLGKGTTSDKVPLGE